MTRNFDEGMFGRRPEDVGSTFGGGGLHSIFTRFPRVFAMVFTLAALLTIDGWAVPANADPAYTASSLLDIFSKDKAALKASKVKYRKVCLEGDTDPACGPPPAPTHVNLQVNFDFGSDRLTSSARENLGQLAEALKDPALTDVKFDIDGHTDARGGSDFNRTLSERRAQAVVAFLKDNGVDARRLKATGYGSSKPKVPDPYAGANRRVEAYVAP